MRYPLLVLAALYLCGCGLSPIQKVTVAEKTFTATVENLDSSMKEGLISDQQTRLVLQRLVNETDAALDVAKEAAVNGETFNFNFAWRKASQLLDRLLIEAARNAKAK